VAVPRIKIPSFVKDVIEDPRQRGILIAGVLSMFAVGLVPRILSPGLPSAQEQLRAEPEIQNLLLLASFLSAATVVLGGLVSDLFRHRALLIGGLIVMLVASAVSIVVDDGPVFYAGNFAAVTAAGVVLAYAIGSVAVAYEGIPRATALGAVYGAYGAGTALAPALLTIILVRIPSGDPSQPAGFAFETWLAYLLAALAAGLALWAAGRWMPSLPDEAPAPKPVLFTLAVWAISILALVSGILALTRGSAVVSVALVSLGALGLATAMLRIRQSRAGFARLHFDQRGLAAALGIGIVVGFVQTIPLVLLPALFEYALDYGTLFALLAIAPFAIALFVAGPVSGLLLQRFEPRKVMAFGTGVLGLANILLAAVFSIIGDDPNYLAFIVPLVFIGAGFVFSTTVRTAIVFASTPRGLPASAAAINETSVGLGSRIGVIFAITVVATTALDSARSKAAGRPDAAELVEEFRHALEAVGTPRFREIIGVALDGADTLKRQAYASAYIDGVELALIASGVVGILGAVLAWFLLGKRDPLHTVFDMQDERDSDPAGESV
jgi:MFS family permease